MSLIIIVLQKSFEWKKEHQDAFENTIKLLTLAGSPALGHFNADAKTILITDISRIGFGFALMQGDIEDENRLRLITCHSKVISDAETRYSVTELGATGVEYAINKCLLYLEGTEFEVWTDHAPLVDIYNTYL